MVLANLSPQRQLGTGLLLLLATAAFSLTVGSADVGLGDVWSAVGCWLNPGEACNGEVLKQRILFQLRLPRILTAFVTGAGLAVAGAVLQTATRNPLADPYLFGISSGASFGAVIAIASVGGGFVSVTAGALAGAGLSVFLVLMLAGNHAGRIEHLLLSGVAVSFMLAAGTSLLLYMAEPEAAANVLFWMMGSFSRSQWSHLPLLYITFAVCLALFLGYGRRLNVLLAGDESAHTLGVNVSRMRLMMLLLCSVLTAVLVAQSGGIGFVGLMIPHIVRYLTGAEITRVTLFSALLGGIFMIWVDVVARSILPHQVLPIGIITSALGSLFFFVILKARQSSTRFG